MPVRKIPRNYRNITGAVSRSNGDPMVRYESALERDLYELLDFDINVHSYEEQPVKIAFEDENGKQRHYVPDVLVIYRDDIIPAKHMRPMLCEVKYRQDLRKNWAEYKPKIRAGMRYAAKKKWDFRIMTEREIRTTYLQNVKFLRRFRKAAQNYEFERLLLKTMFDLRQADPQTLLLAVFRDKWNQAQLIPSLWRLIALRKIGVDLTEPITMRSPIWCYDEY